MTNDESGNGGRAPRRSKDELARDLRGLVSDGQALLRSTTDLSGDALLQARQAVREKLAGAKVRVSEVSRVAAIRGRQAATATDTYVHENPWPAIGIAAGIGFLIGALLARR